MQLTRAQFSGESGLGQADDDLRDRADNQQMRPRKKLLAEQPIDGSPAVHRVRKVRSRFRDRTALSPNQEKGCSSISASSFSDSTISIRTPPRDFHQVSGSKSEYRDPRTINLRPELRVARARIRAARRV
jgi:hypothetical protein